MTFALIILVVLIACAIQYISGMGFGMVAVPAFIIYFGPIDGVTWGNICGLLLNFSLMIVLFKEIEWRKFVLMTLAGIPGIILAALSLRELPAEALHLVLGTLMLLMVLFSIFALKLPAASDTATAPLVTTGFVGAMLAVTVAQSGPVMAAYAQATRWKQNLFAATIQPYFFILNLLIIPMKYYLGMIQSSDTILSWHTPMMLVAVLVGTASGKILKRWVSARQGRDLAIAIAGFGAVYVLLQGFGILS